MPQDRQTGTLQRLHIRTVPWSATGLSKLQSRSCHSGSDSPARGRSPAAFASLMRSQAQSSGQQKSFLYSEAWHLAVVISLGPIRIRCSAPRLRPTMIDANSRMRTQHGNERLPRDAAHSGHLALDVCSVRPDHSRARANRGLREIGETWLANVLDQCWAHADLQAPVLLRRPFAMTRSICIQRVGVAVLPAPPVPSAVRV